MFNTDEKYIRFAPDDKAGAAGSSTEAKPGEPSDEPKEADEPEVEVEEGAEDGDESETPPGVGPKKGPPPGHPRWEKVYAGFKMAQRYSQYGSPEKVEADLRRLQRYDEQIEAAEEKGKGDTEETQELREARDKVSAQLKKMFPWFERAEEALNDHATIRESLRMRAAESTVAYMEENGIEVDQESYDQLTGVLSEIISNSKRLFTLYATAPERAVKEAVAEYEKPFKTQATRKQKADLIKGKEPHKALPKPAPKSAGGPSATAAKPEPKDIREAEKIFTERLREVNRG